MPLPPDSISSQDSLDSNRSVSMSRGPQHLYSHQNGSSLFSTPGRAQTSLVSSGFPPQSAPSSPHYRPFDPSGRFGPHSAPNTPDRGNQEPPHIQRMLDKSPLANAPQSNTASMFKKEEELLLDILGKSSNSAFTKPQQIPRAAAPAMERLHRAEITHRTPVGGTVNNWPNREPARLDAFRPSVSAPKSTFQSRAPLNRPRIPTEQASNCPLSDNQLPAGECLCCFQHCNKL